ncbi:hypothetical protein OPQ81_002321 [Rhizoctonia solani]|nr:hypothetical protein OPQ81_002321 [Rhizoctonia solani]
MNVDRWLYKISKILRKCTRHVNASEVSYPLYGHQMVRSRASTIATNKGLGTALLIAPPVLILTAAGIATTSILRAPPPADHNPPDITVTPTSSIPPAKDLLSGIQSQLQSIVTVEKRLDHTTTVSD